jgi:hypothetical protein
MALSGGNMTIRQAACCCGQLTATVEGEPVRRSMCHCLECQRRTGSIFGVQARWPRGQVKLEGKATKYVRAGDSGGKIDFYFCPTCGSTVYWVMQEQPDIVAVTVGSFADPKFPPPKFSVYESRRHPWFRFAEGIELEHLD